MRAVVQRVTSAQVRVARRCVGEIKGPGLVILLGITHADTADDVDRLATKITQLRIMADEQSVTQCGGSVLVVSQFTLYGDTRKGRRPSWTKAAPGAIAEPLYRQFCAAVASAGVPVATGEFGAQMEVELVGDGPVTLIIDSESQF
ncbi:MAG TPA: D-aminoacyl-tRNA deacylase [Aeromicrobium sp.]|nr:D-aminoacyl-tRNA deacylase [Aeromicrobium sp.]